MAVARRFEGLAVVVSVGSHALLLGVILWRLGTAPVVSEPPVMNIELTPWRRPPAELKPPPRLRASQPLLAPALHAPAAPPATAASPPPVVLPGAEGQGPAAALRRLLGCAHADLMQLSPSERQDCQDRMAAGARPSSALRLDLSRHGVFTQEAEPYLQRAPKRGCKLKAGGDVDPMGKAGAASGVSCAWRF